jgi:hypothetical protein
MSNVVNLDVAKRVDIICRKGDTFKLEIDLKAADGTLVPAGAYNYKMEVRAYDYANTSYTDPAGDTDATIILSTEDSSTLVKKITSINNVAGKATFGVTSAIMKTVAAGMYVYDIEATSTGANPETQTWLYGTFKINEDISV